MGKVSDLLSLFSMGAGFMNGYHDEIGVDFSERVEDFLVYGPIVSRAVYGTITKQFINNPNNSSMRNRSIATFVGGLRGGFEEGMGYVIGKALNRILPYL